MTHSAPPNVEARGGTPINSPGCETPAIDFTGLMR
jgi:hypothetical protein